VLNCDAPYPLIPTVFSVTSSAVLSLSLSPPVTLSLLVTNKEEEEAAVVKMTRQVSLRTLEKAFRTASETLEKEGSLLGEGSLGD
jgi:Cu/Ag efflux pump CusA